MMEMPDGPSASRNERVAFRLTPDEEGFPPGDWEHLWADAVGANEYRLDNTPFFARGVSYRDVVRTVRDGDFNVFQEVVRAGGHSTIRVILTEAESAAGFVARLSEMGYPVESSHIPGYVAVDVPSSSSRSDLVEYLDQGESEGLWEYEIGAWAI
jgi:hypothetical protein